MGVCSHISIIAQDRNEERELNVPALVVVVALILIWYFLSPIWLPCLWGLFSLLRSVFTFLVHVLVLLAVVFLVIFGVAAASMVVGGCIPPSFKSD